jgi:hypothetical protein
LNNSAGRVVQRGETVDANSPTRVQKTAQHFNKDSWNIRQKTGQTDIKSPWYKRAWNYFNDPYKPMETPKTETSTKTSSTTAESAHKIKESIKRKLHGVQNILKKKVSKEEMGGTINIPLDNIIEDFFKNNNI